ncbi:DMT family transporter [Paucibacter sp. Y2R2-4]|uniref:DMT family transporter n=1 Tax=Paucibacter sp. Y2R2-4 TaxID=2893553 RepID=UPI0021E430ED|nr:DMT family transporter [Paucibacter sp. Y2R2-4]MCV2350263.1 DMT family transporter [Paucibacter sp. Y2R2-4]
MWTGIVFALAAGLMWGLVFVAPLMLADYPPLMLTIGRYLAFGLIALPLGWMDKRALRRLSRGDWLQALSLSLVGNFLYYLLLSSAIQMAGAPLPTVIIGTLPVVIAICANLRSHQPLPWPKLLPSLGLIALGIGCVNQDELRLLLQANGGSAALRSYGLGALLALGAVACWTWYPIRNADWLQAHPQASPRVWATAQGLMTLPVALLGLGMLHLSQALGWPLLGAGFQLPLGPRALDYIGLMLAVGLFSSWLGTLCWNEASQRLPTSLVGQLIVFESLAALAYAFMLRGQWPSLLTIAGIALLLAGVIWALRDGARRRPAI